MIFILLPLYSPYFYRRNLSLEIGEREENFYELEMVLWKSRWLNAANCHYFFYSQKELGFFLSRIHIEKKRKGKKLQ